jgi:hypothetical protein
MYRKLLFSASTSLISIQFISGLFIAFLTSAFFSSAEYSSFLKDELFVKYFSMTGIALVSTPGRLGLESAKKLINTQVALSFITTFLFFVVYENWSFSLIALFSFLNLEWLYYRYSKIKELLIVSAVSKVIGIGFVYYAIKTGLVRLAIFGLIVQNITMLFYHHRIICNAIKNLNLNISYFLKLSNYGIFYIVSGMLLIVDTSLFSLLLDHESFANFGFNAKLFRIFVIFGVLMSTLTFEFKTLTLQLGLLLSFVFGGIILSFLLLFHENLVLYIDHPEYVLIRLSSILFALGSLMGIVNSFLFGGRYLSILSKRQMLRVTVVALMINISLNLVLFYTERDEYYALGFLASQLWLFFTFITHAKKSKRIIV